MTNLTEQWKKGKLPEGDYYIKRRNGYLPYDNIDSRGVWRNSIDEDIVEVLAPVPSYEEWKRFIDANDGLFEAVKLLTIERDMTQEENQKLKELLKDLQSEAIDALTAIQKDCESDTFSIFNYPEVQTFYTLSEKIDEVLK